MSEPLDAVYAARIAPVINRVYVSLRRAAGPATRELVDRRRIERGGFGFLADAYFAILDHPIPAAGLMAIHRYAEEAEVAESLARTIDAGLVVRDAEGAIALTDDGRDLLIEFEATIAEATAARWSIPPGVNEVLGRLLVAGRASGGPAFAAMTPPYEPDGATPTLLFGNRLGALRHHRADAHAAAWTARGRTAAEMLVLSDAAERRAIEEDTDRRDAPIYAVLTAADRDAFHDGLSALTV